jgi:hypothetical protein
MEGDVLARTVVGRTVQPHRLLILKHVRCADIVILCMERTDGPLTPVSRIISKEITPTASMFARSAII